MADQSLLCVLVVEENPMIASRLNSILSGLGWSVDYAASGKQAIRLGLRKAYDLILMDNSCDSDAGNALAGALESSRFGCPAIVDIADYAQAADMAGYKSLITQCQQLATVSPVCATA